MYSYYSNLQGIQNSKSICKSNGVPVDSKKSNDPSATKQRLQENSSFNKTPVLCMYKSCTLILNIYYLATLVLLCCSAVRCLSAVWYILHKVAIKTKMLTCIDVRCA